MASANTTPDPKQLHEYSSKAGFRADSAAPVVRDQRARPQGWQGTSRPRLVVEAFDRHRPSKVQHMARERQHRHPARQAVSATGTFAPTTST